jgi:hypothetical protein
MHHQGSVPVAVQLAQLEAFGVRRSAAVALVAERQGLTAADAAALAGYPAPAPTADEFAQLLTAAGVDVQQLAALERCL